MKTIELKHIQDKEKNIDFDYRKWLALIVNAPLGGQGGVSVADMRRAIKIADKLEASNGSLLLEDAEHEFLNERVQQFPWPKAHRVYVEFADEVANAQSPKSAGLAGVEAKATEAG